MLRFARDLLFSLDDSIARYVAYTENAIEIYRTTKELFTGNDLAKIRDLKEKLDGWKFRSDWLKYLNGFELLVS